MAITITQRTATSSTTASGASTTITVPTGTVVGDVLILVIGNAGTAGPTVPRGWSSIYGVSAGTGQFCSVWWAVYSSATLLTFTNAASVNAWCCNSYSNAYVIRPIDRSLASVSTTNNTTQPTGAPTTGVAAFDFNVLCYVWSSAATISTPAAGSTIERTQANGTSISAAIGRNNTTSLAANTTVTAFSQTLSGNNNRKTGVSVLLRVKIPRRQSAGHPFCF